MNKAILQIPMNKSLKDDAERVALSKGFSSLQEFIRVFLVKVSNNSIDISFQESINLSDKSEKLYLKIDKDFKNNKNIYTADNTKDLIKQLNEN